VREVEKLLDLPRSAIRALVHAGFVTPARGPRNAWRFSFRDLVLLRTAQALAAAQVPHRRIVRSLKELRRRLPESMPLSGLNIGAVGERVVVSEGTRRWQAESGQYLLAFEGDPDRGSLRVVERGRVEPTAAEWFDKGVAAEPDDADAAVKAYEQAIAADSAFIDAYVNLGALLHDLERHAEAERVYRRALRVRGADGMLYYNLGVLLEDMDRKAEALEAYRSALQRSPNMPDCHYNLALLCEALGRPRDAIRHMSKYRRLMTSRSG